MASQRATILPRRMKAMITEMDSCAYLRPMAKLTECRCRGGRQLISSMGLQHLMAYPEVRALQQGIYRWLAEDAEGQCQEMTAEEVRTLVR